MSVKWGNNFRYWESTRENKAGKTFFKWYIYMSSLKIDKFQYLYSVFCCIATAENSVEISNLWYCSGSLATGISREDFHYKFVAKATQIVSYKIPWISFISYQRSHCAYIWNYFNYLSVQITCWGPLKEYLPLPGQHSIIKYVIDVIN